MKGMGAAACSHVDNAACRTAEFGLEASALHLQLAHELKWNRILCAQGGYSACVE